MVQSINQDIGQEIELNQLIIDLEKQIDELRKQIGISKEQFIEIVCEAEKDKAIPLQQRMQNVLDYLQQISALDVESIE